MSKSIFHVRERFCELVVGSPVFCDIHAYFPLYNNTGFLYKSNTRTQLRHTAAARTAAIAMAARAQCGLAL